MNQQHLDIDKLRLGFIVYGGISRVDWRHITLENIHFEWREFQNMLIPLLRKADLAKRDNPKLWAEKILSECKAALENLFPFRENEAQFLHELLENGKIDASLITTDKSLQQRIHINPALLWKAENVKQYKYKK